MNRLKLLILGVGVTVLAAPGFAAGDADKGEKAFAQCGVCHHTDKTEKKMGPGLKGLFKKDKMANGKPVSDANVMAIINDGGAGMPAYKEMLTDEERGDLLAYLKTL